MNIINSINNNNIVIVTFILIIIIILNILIVVIVTFIIIITLMIIITTIFAGYKKYGSSGIFGARTDLQFRRIRQSPAAEHQGHLKG